MFYFHAHRVCGFEDVYKHLGDWRCQQNPVFMAFIIYFYYFYITVINSQLILKSLIRKAKRRVAYNNLKTMDKREKRVSSMIIFLVLTTAMFFIFFLSTRICSFIKFVSRSGSWPISLLNRSHPWYCGWWFGLCDFLLRTSKRSEHGLDVIGR